MYKWENIQTKTEAEFIFRLLLKKIKDQEIKRIFSPDSGVPEKQGDDIIYDLQSVPLIFEFKDGNCLFVRLIFYSELYIEYRELTAEEKRYGIRPDNREPIDYFYGNYRIHSWDFTDNGERIEDSFGVKTIIDIQGPYSPVSDIRVHGFHDAYEKWISDGRGSSTVTIPAGGDYFNAITFVLENGIELTIRPEDAFADGYYDLVIRDPKNLISYRYQDLRSQ